MILKRHINEIDGLIELDENGKRVVLNDPIAIEATCKFYELGDPADYIQLIVLTDANDKPIEIWGSQPEDLHEGYAACLWPPERVWVNP